MGSWGNGLLENDGAQDVIAALRERGPAHACSVIDECLENFEAFLQRDERGETFRPIGEDEVREQDEAIRNALADLPHLLEGVETAGELDGILTDVGDHEAQGLVAACVLLCAASGVRLPKVPEELAAISRPAMNLERVHRARAALRRLLQHERLLQQFTRHWIKNVRALDEAFSREVRM